MAHLIYIREAEKLRARYSVLWLCSTGRTKRQESLGDDGFASYFFVPVTAMKHLEHDKTPLNFHKKGQTIFAKSFMWWYIYGIAPDIH